MKLINYYVAFIAPILIIVLLWTLGFSVDIGLTVLIYYLYRVFLDYYKLKSDKIVGSADIWKFVLPVWTFIYFRQLYFQ